MPDLEISAPCLQRLVTGQTEAIVLTEQPTDGGRIAFDKHPNRLHGLSPYLRLVVETAV